MKRIWATVVMGFLSACSGATGDMTGDGGPGPDGGSSSEGGDGGSNMGLPSGTIGVLQQASPTGDVYTSGALFFTDPGPLPTAAQEGSVCATAGIPLDGDCCWVGSGGDAGTPPAVMDLSAGQVTVKIGSQSTMLMERNLGATISYAGTLPAWTPPAVAMVSTSGAGFPAAQAMIATVAPLVPTPTIPKAGFLEIAAASPFTLTWTTDPSTAGEIVNLTLSVPPPQAGQVLCQASDTKGTLTVSTALLSKLTGATVVGLTLTRQNYSVSTTAAEQLAVNASYVVAGVAQVH